MASVTDGARFVQDSEGWRVYVDVTIRRNSDGATAVNVDEDGYPADDDGDIGSPVYMWREGNYRCDCNRHLFFERAQGRDPDVMAGDCTEDRYTVVAPSWLADR